MKRTGLWRTVYLCWLARPAHERALYRQILRRKVARIVEIGMGDGRRARRMISAALKAHAPDDIRYTGIDLFEARPAEQCGLSLKRAHQEFGRMGIHLRLIPGDPYSALARSANALTGSDLIVISADQDPAALDQAWFYLPRMLHQQSLVLLEEGGPNPVYRQLDPQQFTRRRKSA